jgi:hypothetical protein
LGDRRIKWAGHLAQIRKGEVHTRFWWGNLKERHNFEDLDIVARITLNWFFKNWHGKSENGKILFRMGTGGGLL